MPTIIDSLWVTLGLKADDFHKEKKKVESGLTDLTKAATKFLAVIGSTYEVKRFVENQIAANAALNRLSENLETSANAISAWSNATEAAGGRAGDLESTIKMLSRAQTELKFTGQTGLLPYFSALGVNINNAAGPLGMLMELHNRFVKMDRTTAFNLGGIMGIPEGEMNLLLKNQADFERFMKNVQKYAVTKEQADTADKLYTSMVWVKQSFESFGRTLLQDVSPMLVKVVQAFRDFGDWCANNKQLVGDFLTIMAVGIGAISIAALPITAAAVAFVAFGAALALAWQDYQVWKSGGDSLFKDWGPAIDIVSAAFGGLEAVLGKVFKSLAIVGAMIMAAAHGDWASVKDLASGRLLSGQSAGVGAYGAGNGTDRQRFIAAASSKLGVPEGAIDAQLREETGPTGAKTIGNYNYGNIKAGAGYGGSSVTKYTREYFNGTSSGELSQFRSYSTPEQAAADYAAMIRRKFPSAVGAQTAAAFAGGLQVGGYATDPNYIAKISAIGAGIPGAGGAAGSAVGGMSYPVSNSRSQSVSVGEINIHTNQTDAPGIMKDAGKSLSYLFTAQANTGQQ